MWSTVYLHAGSELQVIKHHYTHSLANLIFSTMGKARASHSANWTNISYLTPPERRSLGNLIMLWLLTAEHVSLRVVLPHNRKKAHQQHKTQQQDR